MGVIMRFYFLLIIAVLIFDMVSITGHAEQWVSPYDKEMSYRYGTKAACEKAETSKKEPCHKAEDLEKPWFGKKLKVKKKK